MLADGGALVVDGATLGRQSLRLFLPGLLQREIVGWTVSCDARLFALEYPGMPVLTFGPGAVEHAHSDHEHVRVADVAQAAQWIAAYILQG